MTRRFVLQIGDPNPPDIDPPFEVDPGAFTITGGDARLTKSRGIGAGSGSFRVTGSAATLITSATADTFFEDDFETGDDTVTKNTARWLSWPNSSTVQALSGARSGRSRHSASIPGGDVGDGPTEFRLSLATNAQAAAGAGVGRVWVEYYLYVPINHWHADKSGRGQLNWGGLSLTAGSTTLTSSTGSLNVRNRGMPIAIYGGGDVGDDGIVCNIMSVTSPSEATIGNIYRFTFAPGFTAVRDRSHYVSQGPIAAPVSNATNVTATKIVSSNNHKHFVIWGKAYGPTQLPHPYILVELWPIKNTDPTFGNSWMEVRYALGGTVRAGTTNGWDVAALNVLGVVSSGTGGIIRGGWTRIRWHVDVGSGIGAADGKILCWRDNTLMVNKTNLVLYPHDGVFPWWNNFYINGWCNGGWSQDTDYFIDDLKVYTSNPGW